MFKSIYTIALVLLVPFAVQAKTRMVTEIHYLPSDPNSINGWIDSFTYTYSGNRGGAPGEVMKYDTCTRYRPSRTKIKPFERKIQRFNMADQVVSIRTQYPSGFNPVKWVTLSEEVYTYDRPGGVIVSDSFYSYTSIPDTPRYLYLATLCYYNAKRQVTDSFISTGVLSSTGRDTPEYYRFRYDSKDRCIEKRRDYLQNAVFYPYWADSFAYTGNNTFYSYRKHTYANTGGGQEAYRYTYNANNDVYMQYNMLDYNGRLDTSGRLVNIYDNRQCIIQTYKQDYDPNPSPLWTDISRQVNTYNNEGHLTSDSSQIHVGNNQWITDDNKIIGRYYYEYFAPISVNEVAGNNMQLQLYPVPATNTLHLQLTEDKQQLHTVAITDMQGKQVLHETYISNTTQSIDISSLPSGVYNINLLSTKGSVQHSKFTVVR
jgi:hypothetical protein